MDVLKKVAGKPSRLTSYVLAMLFVEARINAPEVTRPEASLTVPAMLPNAPETVKVPAATLPAEVNVAVSVFGSASWPLSSTGKTV